MVLNLHVIEDVEDLNPWIIEPKVALPLIEDYFPRLQENYLMSEEWDDMWILLIGPRRSGKTTLGFHLSQKLINSERVDQLLYLNCDFGSIRESFQSPRFVKELLQHFKLKRPIVFIDEVQRLDNPGLLLKEMIDLNWDIKWIASGSSQLEIKSKVQEHLTGREVESIVLPLSSREITSGYMFEEHLIYGSYPRVVKAKEKKSILGQLYKRYIDKDIIEILRLNKPELIEKLIILIAHGSGQLVNYQQLASDCRVSSPTVQSYLTILEKTYVIHKITPFVGNKRSEITSNPKYYFIDNGFRNQAIRNFNELRLRGDVGLLVEGFIFQELLKLKTQQFYDFDIHYWRTKAGAEVDFIIYKNPENLLPVEVKYRSMNHPVISKGYRSFIEAYKPKQAVMITKNLLGKEYVGDTIVHFIPVERLDPLFNLIQAMQ